MMIPVICHCSVDNRTTSHTLFLVFRCAEETQKIGNSTGEQKSISKAFVIWLAGNDRRKISEDKGNCRNIPLCGGNHTLSNFTNLEPFRMLTWKHFGLIIGKRSTR